MIQPVYIVEEVGAIVQETALSLMMDINYLHGHPKEVLQRLQEFDLNAQDAHKKFPLVALFQDFPEEFNTKPGTYAEVKLNLIVATLTEGHLTSPDRYAQNFKPVLYPIYFELLNQLYLSPRFRTLSPLQIPHTKIDRVYWGKEGLYGSEKNVFNDRMDCIEIRGLDLVVEPKNCHNS